MKRWLARIGLLLAGLLVGIGLAELGLRLRSPAGPEAFLLNGPSHYDKSIFEKDDALKQVLKPNAVGDMHTPEFHTTVRINSLGVRGPELPPKEPGELRILAVGDSFTLGVQVEEDETFSGRLGPLLTERLGRPVRVINAGVDSYGTLQAKGLAERLIEPTQTDLVLLVFFLGNDLFENQGFHPGRPRGPEPAPLPGWQRWLSDWSYIWFHLQVLTETNRLSNDPRRGQRYKDELAMFTRGNKPLMGAGRTEDALQEFARFCEGTRCAITLAPPVFAVHEERAQPTLDAFGVEGDLDLHRPAREVKKLLPEGVPSYDLGPPLEAEAPERPLYFVYDGHWNAAGHEVVAASLADFLEPQLEGL